MGNISIKASPCASVLFKKGGRSGERKKP